MEKTKINKDMLIGEILQKYPNLAEVFLGFGMFCVSCPASTMETLEQASAVHGIDLEFLLHKLNENAK